MSPRDSFVATTWWTAHIAHRATEALGRGRFLYLIQEYEPFTFPMGSHAALARESYDFPHFAIFSTELLRDYFRATASAFSIRGGGRAARLGVLRQRHHPGGPVTVHDIAVGARGACCSTRGPKRTRRGTCSSWGCWRCRARSRTASSRTAGSSTASVGERGGWLPLGGGAWMSLRPRQSQEEYREFLRGHDVGLSLMYTPHPSLVPIEMASAGMLVVTNSFANKTGERLAAISSNMIVTEPTVGGIAAGLRQAVAEVGDYERRVAGSRVDWSTSWDSSFDEGIVRRIRGFLAADEAVARPS